MTTTENNTAKKYTRTAKAVSGVIAEVGTMRRRNRIVPAYLIAYTLDCGHVETRRERGIPSYPMQVGQSVGYLPRSLTCHECGKAHG